MFAEIVPAYYTLLIFLCTCIFFRHPTSCCSMAELVSVLFYHTMRYKGKRASKYIFKICNKYFLAQCKIYLKLRIWDAVLDVVPFVQCKKRENTPPWVFFTFFKILQMLPNRAKHHTVFNKKPISEKSSTAGTESTF